MPIKLNLLPDLCVREFHSILIHASSHYMLQLLVLDQTVAIQIVNFEQKLNFVLRRLAGKLMHGVDELLEWNRPRIVFVEDLKDSFIEEWLKT